MGGQIEIKHAKLHWLSGYKIGVNKYECQIRMSDVDYFPCVLKLAECMEHVVHFLCTWSRSTQTY